MDFWDPISRCVSSKVSDG